jgi:hypothetical protein
MKKFPAIVFSLFCFSTISLAQTIRVSPTGVNVNSQNPTVVFLTFGPIPPGYAAAEGVWCGELVPAPPPALGFQCRPDTIYGALPARYDRRAPTGNAGLTDIMAIPPSVVRRAYQAAVNGASAGFFYVRRFVSTTGQPDQFVNVTCRMTGGGARVPFALTNVEIKTDSKEPILFVKAGEKFPNVAAEIQYNGTGRLKGRWEIVQPGEEPPSEQDLLTEATLPVERRGQQRRFTQIARFNHFLPPGGKFVLPLETTQQMPIVAEGQYLLLLRIEATDDKESDSDLREIGVGAGVVHSGAVAAFPLPPLKFFVSGNIQKNWQDTALLAPTKDAILADKQPLVFGWRELPDAAIYHLKILENAETPIFAALLPATTRTYQAPSWFSEKFKMKNLSWRVLAIDKEGNVLSETNSGLIQVR